MTALRDTLTCSVVGCDRPFRCKGFCNAHYLTWRKYGDALADHRPVRQPCTMDACGERNGDAA